MDVEKVRKFIPIYQHTNICKHFSELMDSISKAIKLEMESTFKMIKTAVSRMDGNFWKDDDKDWVYAYILFHAVEALEFYSSSSAEAWKALSEISANSREVETERLRKKDKLFFENYISLVETQVFSDLETLSDEDLLVTDGFSSRGSTSRLHKYIYVIRHTGYHLGELTKYLRNLDRDRIRWE